MLIRSERTVRVAAEHAMHRTEPRIPASGTAELGFESVYADLRQIATSMLLHENSAHTLQATAVVHEAFMRLAKNTDARRFKDTELLAIASRVIRQVLVDHSRRRHAAKRARTVDPRFLHRVEDVTINDAPAAERAAPNGDSRDLEQLSLALERLRRVVPRAADVVELHFFGGLSMSIIAEVLGCARSTVQADWAFARAMLLRELTHHD